MTTSGLTHGQDVVELLRQNQQRYERSQEKLAELPEGSGDRRVRQILMTAQARTALILQLHLQTHNWDQKP